MTSITAALYLTIVVAIFRKLGSVIARSVSKHLKNNVQRSFVNIMLTFWALCGIVSVAADFLSNMTIDTDTIFNFQKIGLITTILSCLIITVTLIWRIRIARKQNQK